MNLFSPGLFDENLRGSPTNLLIIVVLFGIVLRFWNVYHDPALWLDEVFSAQLAQSPLENLLLAVPRFDTHPPLYYLQLHLWAQVSTSDAWLILNSALLDILALSSLFYVVSRIYGRAAGLWVAAVYAVLPLIVFFAQNVRMYAMFFLLVIWLWYVLERRVEGECASIFQRLCPILLGVAATLTHGLGFFVVFFLYFQAIVRSYFHAQEVSDRQRATALARDYLPVALAAGYSLSIGFFRQTEGLEAFSLDGLGVHLTITFFGMEFPAPALAGFIGIALILALPLLYRQTRPLLFGLFLVPFVVLLAVSLTVKSVFMYRTMGLFLPFLAITLGTFYHLVWRQKVPRTQVIPLFFLGLFSLCALNSSISFRKAGYKEIANIWITSAAPDAVLFVQGPVNLWGVTRYLEQVPPFSALAVQAPVREGLLRLKYRLEGTYFERAGLFGESDHLVFGSREIWPYPQDARLRRLSRYWALNPPEGNCFRLIDSIMSYATARDHILIECQAQTRSTGLHYP